MKSTFKKSLFFAAWCVAFLFGTVAFYSCSNEDLDEDSVQSKAELFRAKAKELSKKYGVDVTLNEENIEKMAETMTMEQLEEDFQMFAAMKMDTISLECKMEAPKKLRFKTKKRLKETSEESNRDKEYSGSMTIESKVITIKYKMRDPVTNKMEEYRPTYTIGGSVSWKYKQTGESKVNVSLDIIGSPSATGGGSFPIYSASIIGNNLSFNVQGTITVTSTYYHHNIGCSVNYDEQAGMQRACII